jgi:hypothetical protein
MSDDVGTAYVRESGCGIQYVLNLEDVDETQTDIIMNREQAERLYVVLGRMLGKQMQQPVLPMPQAVWPNGWVRPHWMRG